MWQRLILPVLLTAVLVPAPAAAPVDAARMDQVVKSFADARQFMGSVLVARGAEVLFSKGYGYANLEWEIANTPSTRFRLGSVTKQFTAACILLLEERGKLSVEDPIRKYLPDSPAAWDAITIRHLLTHTSGIPNFTDFPDYGPTKMVPTTTEKIVLRFRDRPLDFKPGEKYAYSNSGYVLLGYVIEKITGRSYEKFLEENVLKPLGMKDTGYETHSTIIRYRASGYAPRENGIVNADYVDMTIPYAAGALYSTTRDLLRWTEGLFGGKLLSPESLRKMTTPSKRDYAFGLMVRTSNGTRVISHGGGIDGFSTFLAYYPEDRLTVGVLSNLSSRAPAAMARDLAAVAHGETVVLAGERKEIRVPAQTLSSYTGTYELQPGFDLVVTLENGQLMTQATGQPKVPVYAESEMKFFLKVVDAQIVFTKDEKGMVNGLVLYQGGAEIKARRK